MHCVEGMFRRVFIYETIMRINLRFHFEDATVFFPQTQYDRNDITFCSKMYCMIVLLGVFIVISCIFCGSHDDLW